jgi:hypothetical protein
MSSAQTLNSNQWVFDVTGVLQHCVTILKLCHQLTDELAKIPLTQINPQLNEVICQATGLVVPRFDALLRALAGENIDIRLTEARASALVTACWSLVVPFYVLNAKFKETFGGAIKEMEMHHNFLRLAVEEMEESSGRTQPTKVVEQKPSETKIEVQVEKQSTPPQPVARVKAVSLRKADDATVDLLNDEAPADPSTS